MMHFNRLFYIAALIAVFSSCNNIAPSKLAPSADTPIAAAMNKPMQPIIDESITDTTLHEGSDYEIVYITMADVSDDYYALDKEMFDLKAQTDIHIDTLGRYYNKKKKRIVVPEGDYDSLYEGEYYPRRYEGVFFSIEQMSSFQEKPSAHIFGLMAGICHSQERAEWVLAKIKPLAPNAYIYRTSLYSGCMH